MPWSVRSRPSFKARWIVREIQKAATKICNETWPESQEPGNSSRTLRARCRLFRTTRKCRIMTNLSRSSRTWWSRHPARQIESVVSSKTSSDLRQSPSRPKTATSQRLRHSKAKFRIRARMESLAPITAVAHSNLMSEEKEVKTMFKPKRTNWMPTKLISHRNHRVVSGNVSQAK